MVACGFEHTIAITLLDHCSEVWTWGKGVALGHGSLTEKCLFPAKIARQQFLGADVALCCAGAFHSVVTTNLGEVWAWGDGDAGALGLGDTNDQSVPTNMGRRRFRGASAVLVSAGHSHTVAVTQDGALWAWGVAAWGKHDTQGRKNTPIPRRVGADDAAGAFGGSKVVMASCGTWKTLAVTLDGALWEWGAGDVFGVGYLPEKLTPQRVGARELGACKVVAAASGECYHAALTHDGYVYTWGQRYGGAMVALAPSALGHGDEQDKAAPTRVATYPLVSLRLGRCRRLTRLHALAFAMVRHDRLGEHSVFARLLDELVRRIVDAAESWPAGRAGQEEGIVRLLGGGGAQEDQGLLVA